mgnify:CR=1 FL=1|jgi:hypothetical protein
MTIIKSSGVLEIPISTLPTGEDLEGHKNNGGWGVGCDEKR